MTAFADQAQSEAERMALGKYILTGFRRFYISRYTNRDTQKTIIHVVVKNQGRWRRLAIKPEVAAAILGAIR